MTNERLIGFAVACITTLAIIALLKGIDGAVLAGAIGSIGGVVGFRIKVWKDKRAEKGGS